MRSGASSEHIQELDLFTIPLSPLGYDFDFSMLKLHVPRLESSNEPAITSHGIN
jgi:hypothetical protein